jgi:hypothetical protein
VSSEQRTHKTECVSVVAASNKSRQQMAVILSMLVCTCAEDARKESGAADVLMEPIADDDTRSMRDIVAGRTSFKERETGVPIYTRTSFRKQGSVVERVADDDTRPLRDIVAGMTSFKERHTGVPTASLSKASVYRCMTPLFRYHKSSS